MIRDYYIHNKYDASVIFNYIITMSKTVKTSLITLSVLIFWMFTGIFSSDDEKSNSIVEIEDSNTLNNYTLVSDRIFNEKPKIFPKKYYAKVRYRDKDKLCTIFSLDNGTYLVKFNSKQKAITPGQSIVLYDKEDVWAHFFSCRSSLERRLPLKQTNMLPRPGSRAESERVRFLESVSLAFSRRSCPASGQARSISYAMARLSRPPF